LKIRALRRHHYIRKLKNQQINILTIKALNSKAFKDENFDKEFDGMKKVRLVEEQIGYEELAVIENFSDDEITFELQRQFNKDKKKKMALQ